MQSINITELQEQLKKSETVLPVSSVTASISNTSAVFQEIQDTVTDLYERYPQILRFVIESNDAEKPYCFTITRESLTYMSGRDEFKKTIVCDLKKANFFINKKPTVPGFEVTFQKYLTMALRDVGDQKATIYEEMVH
jgi:hypothetical protein